MKTSNAFHFVQLRIRFLHHWVFCWVGGIIQPFVQSLWFHSFDRHSFKVRIFQVQIKCVNKVLVLLKIRIFSIHQMVEAIITNLVTMAWKGSQCSRAKGRGVRETLGSQLAFSFFLLRYYDFIVVFIIDQTSARPNHSWKTGK